MNTDEMARAEAEAEKGWYDDSIATFGDRLAAAREAVGLTQAGLADKLGVRKKTIEAWEYDMKEPRANRLQMLSGMLNVSLMWLMTGEGEGVAPPGREAAITDETAALLNELRKLRAEAGQLSERMGRLEARLRVSLSREAA